MTAEERIALIRLKIKRADKHINDLKASLRSFLDSNPYKVGIKRDPKSKKPIYYLLAIEPVPACIAATAGDVLNSLRSALDHLAQHLYLVGTGNAQGYRDKTSFPISPSVKDFKNGLARKVEGMRQDAIDAIRSLEPYAGGKGNDLWTLHRLNNIDKHRMIFTVGSAFRSVDIGAYMGRRMEKMLGQALPALSAFMRPADNMCPLKAGDELFIDSPDAEIDERMQFTFEVAIHEPPTVEGKPILETLVQLRDRTDSIIEAFRSCLA
jgi:hypothetical protein